MQELAVGIIGQTSCIVHMSFAITKSNGSSSGIVLIVELLIPFFVVTPALMAVMGCKC